MTETTLPLPKGRPSDPEGLHLSHQTSLSSKESPVEDPQATTTETSLSENPWGEVWIRRPGLVGPGRQKMGDGDWSETLVTTRDEEGEGWESIESEEGPEVFSERL